MANPSSNNKKHKVETWWSSPLPDFLSNIEDLAMDVAENIALAVMGRMCRKGMGWDFHEDVYVDPRMRNAEYTVDKEAEVERLIEVLAKIETKVPASRRASSLVAFHNALRDAYKKFAEPRPGTPWEDIAIAHKCLESQWFAEDSEPTIFGLTDQYVRIWLDTLKDIPTADAPPDSFLTSILEMDPLLKDQEELLQTPVGKLLLEAKRTAEEEAEKKRKHLVIAAQSISQRNSPKEKRAAARQHNLEPGTNVCYNCCVPIDETSSSEYIEAVLDSEDLGKGFATYYGQPLYCYECHPDGGGEDSDDYDDYDY